MPTYRFYYLDAHENIASAENVTASDDEDAIRTASMQNHDFEVEIWAHTHRIDRLSPKTQREARAANGA